MTTSDRWDKIGAIFERAVELPEERRLDFVRTASAGDRALCEEVLSLLQQDEGTDEFLDGVALDAVEVLDDLSMVGKDVGPYRLIRQLGAGGMGNVYLAERTDGEFEQRVALKLIRRGMDSEQIVRRFRMERQIVARLQHPNIARLLDGGVSEDGRPYFVMEYVEGEPIDRFADRRRLSVDDRLALFQQVCRAVLYAHSQLVVHRDLKPTNVLVTEEGEVRLLDFGIAKVLDDGAGTAITRPGGVVMTPEYASPEQVRGEPVGTSADIYSLGVILYELLSGRRPYDIPSRNPLDVARVVCETEPDRPSTSASRVTGEVASRIGAARATRLDRLRRRLAGDLDVICLKTLRKEPNRRYQSVEALSEDIRRHVSGLPIAARRDSVGYRLSKFVGRHKAGVVTTAMVMMLLSSIVVFYTSRLAEERNKARRKQAESEQVATFLEGLFEQSDPSRAQGESITARELLDRGLDRVRTDLSDQPGMQARMLEVIGRVYTSLGLYDRATPLLEESLDMRRSLVSGIDEDVASSLASLAQALQGNGKYDEAEALFEQSLDMYEALLDPQSPEIATTMFKLAYVRHQQGDFEGAESLYRATLELQKQVFGEASAEVAATMQRLGLCLELMNRVEESAEMQLAALEMNRQLLGEKHPDYLSNVFTVAFWYQRRGQYREAERRYRELLEIDREVFGADHPTVASDLSSLALVLTRLGELEEAERHFKEALSIRRAKLDPGHEDIATTLNDYAILLEKRGDLKAAEANYRQVIDIYTRSLGPDAYYVALVLNNLGTNLTRQGRYDEARTVFRRALRLQQERWGQSHPDIVRLLVNLGSVEKGDGNGALAEDLFRDALAMADDILEESSPRRAAALVQLGTLLSETDRCEEAGPMLEAGIAIYEASGASHTNVDVARQAVQSCTGF